MSKKTQKSIEIKIQQMINKYHLQDKLKLVDIKKWIYEEKGHALETVNKFQEKMFSFFNPDKLNDSDWDIIIDTIMDAWNYLPHKSLNGGAPYQMVRGFDSETGKIETINEKTGPESDIICGGVKMKWDNYWEMIKEMEKQQKLFKKWVEGDVLPKYKKFLEKMVAKNKRDDYYEVADIFFERAMKIGFIEFKDIRREFVQKEFPHWWLTHVLFSNYKSKQVLVALRKMFEFLELVYQVDIKKFGF